MPHDLEKAARMPIRPAIAAQATRPASRPFAEPPARRPEGLVACAYRSESSTRVLQRAAARWFAVAVVLPAGACGGDAGSSSAASRVDTLPFAAPAAVTPGYATGDPSATLVVEEWADFQCPFCAQHYTENHEAIGAALDELGARFEVYEIGAPGHPQSLDATVAARCAGEQGAYAAARDAIYTNQSEWSGSLEADTILRALLLPSVADTAALDDCLRNQRVTVGQILNRNMRAAVGRGVRSTPTTIIRLGNAEQQLRGVVSADAVREAIAAMSGPRAGAAPDDG
jgi:protein-disulfide isomerase